MSEPESGTWILQLENHSRRQGSGISNRDLAGTWQLVDLWDRQARPQKPQSRLLRSLQANLEIQPVGRAAQQGAEGLHLRNSVRLGALELAFHGPGWLQGRRPLLRFHFDEIQLSLGRWRVWQRNLPSTVEHAGPFFALIAAGNDAQGRWLLARGRGGGLARWRCP
jgi:hypothetical protein